MYQMISRGLLVSLALLLIASCGSEKPTRSGPLDKGDKAPKWTGIDLVSGQQKSFPEIQAEYAEQGVQIITFNAKERGEGNPKTYVDSLQFPLVAIADADSIAEDYDVKFIPGLMVVNGEGMVTYRRGWTDLPAGKKVAEFWADEVRVALNEIENERVNRRDR
jgi:hypothetical protein